MPTRYVRHARNAKGLMTDNRPPDAPLTVRQVAKELDVSPRRVRAYLEDRCLTCGGKGCEDCEFTGQRLPGAYKIGGRGGRGTWLIPKRALYYFRRVEAYREGWEQWQKRTGQDEATETDQTDKDKGE